jgi:hypothetical protein
VGANEKKMTTMKGCIKCHGPTDHGGHCERCDSSQLESLSPSGAAPCSAAPVKFPVNPERDENGNAVLYPGMTKFEGVAGLYNTEDGEVVILAPTFEALETHVRKMGVSDEISRDRCILSTWSRLPNA